MRSCGQWVEEALVGSRPRRGTPASGPQTGVHSADLSPQRGQGQDLGSGSMVPHCVRVVLGEGNGNPLQYSCLENALDIRAWWATVQGVARSRTRLSD